MSETKQTRFPGSQVQVYSPQMHLSKHVDGLLCDQAAQGVRCMYRRIWNPVLLATIRCGLPEFGHHRGGNCFIKRGLPLSRHSFYVSALLTGLLVLIAVAGRADEPSSDWLVRTWQVDDGLLENTVRSVAQSADGFLWIATSGGVMRFDGVRFESLVHRGGFKVADRDIHTLYLDRRGRMWLGYGHGDIVCLGPGGVRSYAAQENRSRRKIGNFVEDADGTIYAAYVFADTGLMRLQDAKCEMMSGSDGLDTNIRFDLARGNQGVVWVAAEHKVGMLRHGRFFELAQLEKPAVRISAARDGGVWIATPSQLLKMDENRPPQEEAQLPEGADNRVSDLLEDHRGAVWIGTVNGGLFRFSGRQSEHLESVPHQIHCLAEDSEGNIWVGSEVGLHQVRRRSLKLLPAADGLSFESALSVAEEAGDGGKAAARVWVVSEKGEVVRQDGASWAVVSSQPDWPGGSATCVAAGRHGELWIGTSESGLLQFANGKLHVWNTSEGLASSKVRLLFTSSSGAVWIGMEDQNVLQRLRNGSFQTFSIPGTSAAERRVRAMAEDNAGNIWVGTAAGQLLRVEQDQLVLRAGSQNELGTSIRCLLATDDGSLWIGSSGSGLTRFKAGQLAHITTTEGLGEDYLSQMTVDEDGRLWCAGARGLFHVQMEELNSVAEGRTKRMHSVLCGPSEGFKSSPATGVVVTGPLRRQNGELIFLLRSGLLVVIPEKISTESFSPPVLLASVQVDGQPVAAHDSRSPLCALPQTNLLDLGSKGTSLNLRPNFHKLEFNFCAPSFTSPQNVQCRYRLEGFDDDWVDARSQRSVSIPALPGGDYRFRVTACNEQGIWNETAASLSLTVTPYFWQTRWFQWGMLVLFISGVAVLVRHLSHRRLRIRMQQVERQSALDQERARIARDMHDTLGASLTQINFLGAMASRESMPPAEVRSHVAKITGSSQSLVQQLDEIVWAVDPENDTPDGLATYISQFAEEFFSDLPIRCRIKAPAMLLPLRLTTQVRHNLFLAVKESLNNVARHSGATEVTVHLTIKDNVVAISIEDNGHGFDVAAPTQRHGVANLRQRLAEIGGTCDLESRTGCGTKIILEWRWRNE